MYRGFVGIKIAGVTAGKADALCDKGPSLSGAVFGKAWLAFCYQKQGDWASDSKDHVALLLPRLTLDVSNEPLS
jgi:hypothetical protein